MNYLKTAAFIFTVATSCLKAATIYTDDVTVANPLFYPSNFYEISANAGLQGNDVGTIFTVDQNLIFSYYGGYLDVGAKWYAVASGDVVTPDLLAPTAFLGGNMGGPAGSPLQLQEGQSFLLGFWVDAGGLVNPPYAEQGDFLAGADDRFGWVRLNYTSAGGLKIVDSAFSVSEPIIAGTLITVPEVSTTMIAGLASGMLLRRRRSS